MGVQMIGIDHSLAEIGVREKFSFTKSPAAVLMKKWKSYRGINGVVLLSTCNRMEIYVNSEEGIYDYCKLLCEEKGVDEAEYRSFFRLRDGEEAVRHLFEMTAGLRSLIVGEDQILGQVKEALSCAREEYAADRVLEVLFRQAVTTAKEIKTNVLLAKTDRSSANEAIACLKKKDMTLAGKKCLVIGNGVIGRLTAQTLLEEGADVTVTVRQYHRGIVDIPAGAARIDYGKRYEVLPDCDYVFSATSSPNLTVTKAALEECGLRRRQIFVDLAVPRDMEPEIREISSITLYDLDDFGRQDISPEVRDGLDRASLLIDRGMEEFFGWYECRDLIPTVQKIAGLAARDLCGRLEKPFRRMEREQCRELLLAVEDSESKVTAKLLFALRDGLDTDTFRECLEILERKFT